METNVLGNDFDKLIDKGKQLISEYKLDEDFENKPIDLNWEAVKRAI